MFILILSLLTSAFAKTDRFEIQNLIQKTYTHDNTFCMLNGTRVEIELRGLTKFTDPKDKAYGEHIFYRNKTHLKLLPLNKDHMHSYRFFPAKDGSCSKSHAFAMDKSTSAILFLRENRPYKGKLVIQLYDHIKHVPKDAIETEYATDEILAAKEGFLFKVVPERHDIIMGQVEIEGVKYTYQDRDFHPWMLYSIKGFETHGTETFNHFEWKKHFKDEAEFLDYVGWNPTAKHFTNTNIYIAVNHDLKKECLFISPTKVAIKGTEAWRCL
jgi:hypothetical protein